MSWNRAGFLIGVLLLAEGVSAQPAIDTTACPAGACPSAQATSASSVTIPAFATSGSDRFLFVGAGNGAGVSDRNTTSVIRGGGIIFKGNSALSAGTGAVTCAMPTGGAAPAANDILILVVCGEGDDEGVGISLSTANGFVSVLAEQIGDDGDAAEENPEDNCEVWWKRAAGGDAAPVAADSGDHTTCAIHNFSGVKTTGDPWNVTAGGNDSNANDTSAVIPGATTSVNNTLVVLVQGTSNNGTSTTNCGTVTNADLGSITERFDASNTSGLGGGHCVITGTKATSGSYAASTLTLSATTYKAAFSIALEPALQPETFTEKWDVAEGDSLLYSSGSYYVAPSTSSASVVVTIANVADELGAGVIALTGAHQTTPTGTHGTAEGKAGSPTVTVTADATDFLVDHVNDWGTTLTVGADQTMRWDETIGVIRYGGSTQLGSADDVMSWTDSATTSWVMGAMPVKPSGAPPTCAQSIALLGVGCR